MIESLCDAPSHFGYIRQQENTIHTYTVSTDSFQTHVQHLISVYDAIGERTIGIGLVCGKWFTKNHWWIRDSESFFLRSVGPKELGWPNSCACEHYGRPVEHLELCPNEFSNRTCSPRARSARPKNTTKRGLKKLQSVVYGTREFRNRRGDYKTDLQLWAHLAKTTLENFGDGRPIEYDWGRFLMESYKFWKSIRAILKKCAIEQKVDPASDLHP